MRIEQITFTRFVAAVAIVIFHYGRDIFPFNGDIVQSAFSQAHLGVSYFFLLSGFVMIIAYHHKQSIKPLDYLKNRLARIYPIYLLALLLVVGANLAEGRAISLKQLGLGVFALQSWLPPYPMTLNAPGWSISVEMFFYIAFPFLFNYFFKRYSLTTIAIITGVVWVGSQLALHLLPHVPAFAALPAEHQHELLHYHPLMHLNQFMLGCLVGLAFVKLNLQQRNYDGAVLAMVVALFAVVGLSPEQINYHNGLLAIIFVPLIVLLCLNTGTITTLFNKEKLIFLGEISYGLYILQAPVYMWSEKFFKTVGISSPAALFYFAFAMLLILSAVSYRFLETPLRNKIKNYGKIPPMRVVN